MSVIDCGQCADKILDYEEGLLPEAEVLEVKEHLEGCASCREYKRNLDLSWEKLGDIEELEPTAECRARFWKRVGQESGAEQIISLRAKLSTYQKRARGWRWAALAASIVVVGSVSLWFVHGNVTGFEDRAVSRGADRAAVDCEAAPEQEAIAQMDGAPQGIGPVTKGVAGLASAGRSNSTAVDSAAKVAGGQLAGMGSGSASMQVYAGSSAGVNTPWMEKSGSYQNSGAPYYVGYGAKLGDENATRRGVYDDGMIYADYVYDDDEIMSLELLDTAFAEAAEVER